EVTLIVDPARRLVIGVAQLQGKTLERVHDQSRRLEAVQSDHLAIGVADGDQLSRLRPVDLLQYVAPLDSTLVGSWLLRIVLRRLWRGAHAVTALAGTAGQREHERQPEHCGGGGHRSNTSWTSGTPSKHQSYWMVTSVPSWLT